MTLFRSPIRAFFLIGVACAGAQAPAPQMSNGRTPSVPQLKPKITKPLKGAQPDALRYNSNLIVLDPAHGGADNGATLGDKHLEKDANMALAVRVRGLLAAKGFTVVLTHSSASEDASPDIRVDAANRNHPVACILLHSSSGGHGVHLFTSALTPSRAITFSDDAKVIAPWDTAQVSVVPMSLRLAGDLASAINGMRIPLTIGQASVRPIDSMTCPAVALELSPLSGGGDASDAEYQQHVAESVTNGLIAWRGHVIAAATALQSGRTPGATQPGTPSPGKAISRPKSITPPVEVPPDTSASPVRPRAPIVRKDPNPRPNAGAAR